MRHTDVARIDDTYGVCVGVRVLVLVSRRRQLSGLGWRQWHAGVGESRWRWKQVGDEHDGTVGLV